LEDAGAETEAAIVVGFLESLGIKATAMDRSFHQTPAQNDELMDIVIAVPASQLEAARAAMANRETGFASAKEGEETVLTEDGMVTLDEPAEPESGRES
jgi:intracellular sulfur oxidation DsrE/DsrF family protein